MFTQRILSLSSRKLQLKKIRVLANPISISNYSADTTATQPPNDENELKADQKLGGFAKAFEKHEEMKIEDKVLKEDNVSFAKLLRHSKFIDVSF